MKTYKWDEGLLNEFLKNPQIAADFEEAFTFLRKGSKVDNSRLSLIDIIYRDYTYLRLNSFCKYPIEEMLLESPNYLEGIKYQRKITIPEALKYTEAFYGTLSPVIKTVFKEVYAIKEGRLLAVSPKKARFTGHCNTSKEAEDYLIDFVKSDNMQMLGTITHEFGHATSFYLRGCEEPPYSYNVFSEVESTFPEFLLYEFMEHNSPYYHDAIAAQVECFNGTLEDASLVLGKFDYHYVTGAFVNKPKKLNLINYKLAISQEYDDETISSYFRTIRYPAEDFLPYVYSFLIVIELLEIWRQSPKDALDLYYRLVCLTAGSANKKNDELYKMGIHPSQSYPAYVRRLKKKAQGIKKEQ